MTEERCIHYKGNQKIATLNVPRQGPVILLLIVQSGELKEIRRGEVDTFSIMQTKEDEHLGLSMNFWRLTFINNEYKRAIPPSQNAVCVYQQNQSVNAI